MGRRRSRSSPEKPQISSEDRRRKVISGMSPEISPEWLPDGWIMEVRKTKSGSKHTYYTSPLSGFTFHTKREVMRYLNIDKVEGYASRTCSLGNAEKQLVAQLKHSPHWLPRGWILEIKTRKTGANAGQNYKCYFNPFTGSRFYSKGEVFRYLQSGKLSEPSSDEKRLLKTNSKDNVIALIQYSPDGLPHGWIKEIKLRKSNNASGLRRDSYYTDPVTGYVFRTLKDAFHYIKTGEVSRHTVRTPKRHISDLYSLEKESPPPISPKKLKTHGTTVRRRLFVGETVNSDGQMMIDNDGSHELKFMKKRNIAEAREAKRKKAKKPATKNLGNKRFKLNGRKGGKRVSNRSSEKFSQAKAEGGGTELNPMVVNMVVVSPLAVILPDSLETKQVGNGSNIVTRRASRRLAGLEAVSVADIAIVDQSLESKLEEETIPPEKNLSDDKEESLTEPKADDWLEFPFGDSWPDPCIEFAFKTLTSDIPILEDTAAVEDYFQKQLISLQSSSSSPSAGGLLTFGGPESCGRSKLPADLEKDQAQA